MNYTNYPRRRSNISHLHSLLFFLLFFRILRPAAGDADANGEKESKAEEMRDPSLVERAIGITGLNSRWDAVLTWAMLAWTNLPPPDSTYGQGSDGANVVKEAAVRSFEASKETVERSAVSAARAAGEAVEKTAEKLKRTLSIE